MPEPEWRKSPTDDRAQARYHLYSAFDRDQGADSGDLAGLVPALIGIGHALLALSGEPQTADPEGCPWVYLPIGRTLHCGLPAGHPGGALGGHLLKPAAEDFLPR